MKRPTWLHLLASLWLAAACGIAVRAAEDEPESESEPLHGSVTFSAGAVDVSGSASQYRAHQARNDEVIGGIEAFSLHNDKLTIEGRAIANNEDYKLSLSYKPTSNTVVRAGIENYGRYDNERGGYYPGVNPQSSYDLDEELHYQIGRLWIQAGLQGEDVPTILLGYEYTHRRGDRSTLEWNRAGTIPVSIYPTSADDDERIHVISLDIETDINEIHIQDALRYELYDGDRNRTDVVPGSASGTGTDSGHRVSEGTESDVLSNSLSIDTWVTDWLFLSGGYMYFDLNGEADFRMTSMPVGSPVDKFWFIDTMDMDETSQVVNLGAFLVPLETLTISLGLQAEDTTTSADGSLDRLAGSPALSLPVGVETDVDSENYREEIEVRFSGIPWTLLYARGTFEQGNVDHYERELLLPAGIQELLRNTEEDRDKQTFRVGGTFSPCRVFSLNTYYQHSTRTTSYDHSIDENLAGSANAGYPAYITENQFDKDEVSAKVVLRLTSWLRTAARYQHIRSTTDVETDPIASTRGSVTSGEFRSNRYSLNVVAAPGAKLLLSATYAFEDTANRIPSMNDPLILDDYEGNVHTLLGSANYTVTADTSLSLSCLYSVSSNQQDNSGGVPQAADWQRQGLGAGVRHRFSETLSGTLQYSYTAFDDSNYGNGANDYTAHGLYAGMSLTF